MNNWIRIGVPILVAVLLIVTAVSLTLAITSSSQQAGATAYPGQKLGNAQYSADARCENCPNYEDCPNVGKCTGTCTDNSTGNCGRICSGNASTAQVQQTCHDSANVSRSGSLKGSCGGCRIY